MTYFRRGERREERYRVQWSCKVSSHRAMSYRYYDSLPQGSSFFPLTGFSPGSDYTTKTRRLCAIYSGRNSPILVGHTRIFASKTWPLAALEIELSWFEVPWWRTWRCRRWQTPRETKEEWERVERRRARLPTLRAARSFLNLNDFIDKHHYVSLVS